MSESLRQAIGRVPIIGIVRTRAGRHTVDAVACVVECGLTAVEITTSDPEWARAVRDSIAAVPGVPIGAGTIIEVAQVHAAADAGATFVVAPNVDVAVGEEAIRLGLGWFPGAATPTEIVTAWRAGATAVKVFPASPLGGPDFVRQVRAPLSDIPLVPTGGIGVDRIRDYLDAGALAVGLGSPLFGDAVETGRLDELRSRALRAVQEATRDA